MDKREVRELLLEKIAVEKGFEGVTDAEIEAVDTFLDTFTDEVEKAAADANPNWDKDGVKPPNSYNWAEEFKKGTAGALAGAGVGAIASGALWWLGNMIHKGRNAALHAKFLEALNRAIRMNSVLRGANRERVLSYGESVFNVAPNVATDPNLLASVLASAVHGEGIDQMTLRSLAELESKHTSNRALSLRDFR